MVADGEFKTRLINLMGNFFALYLNPYSLYIKSGTDPDGRYFIFGNMANVIYTGKLQATIAVMFVNMKISFWKRNA